MPILRRVLGTTGQLMLATVIAAAVSAVSLTAIARVQWPAYPSSNQLHALTTVGQVGCVLGLVIAAWLWRTGTRAGRTVAWTAAVTLVSAFSVVTLAMPLGATRLYLFGVSVDQQFRTEYLTRLAQSAALRDMTYFGMPPYYPPGWFWLGGRFAALTGTAPEEVWTVYKPWAIASMAIAAACALVLWNAMARFEYALTVTMATAAVALAYGSPEPYAAMITMTLPPVLVLAWAGLFGGPNRAGGGWVAIAAVGVFLGVTATSYTLLFVFSAFTVTIMALLSAALRRRNRGLRAAIPPLVRLAVIGVITAGFGAITWLPFLTRAAREPLGAVGTALHYLPGDGAELSFPMLQPTLLGALSLLGTIWLVVCATRSVRAAALGIGVLAVYAWSLLSMLATLSRTTLLSFRLQPTLTVLLACAGVFGFIEAAVALARRARDRDEPGTATGVLATAAVLGLAGAVAFSQQIPEVLRPDITVAYTDTDGHGQRADRRPAGAAQYYARIDEAILSATGKPRDNTVVLTADYSFLSYYPYWGFQGLTSHYANPLAQFKQRAKAIEDWADLDDSAEFTRALDELPWRAPTVFLMRHGGGSDASSPGGGSYTLRLAEDVYPNHPNVRRYHVELNPAIFDGPQFTVREIGPFVLAVRTMMRNVSHHGALPGIDANDRAPRQ